MKFNLKVLTIVIGLILLISSTTYSVTSAEENTSENEKINQLSNSLSYYLKDAEIKDENGKIINYDYKKIKSKLSQQQQRELTKIERNSTQMRACPTAEACQNVKDNTKCIVNSINLLDALGATAAAEAINAINVGNYNLAAKAIIKGGVKGGVQGIAGTLIYTAGKCMANGNPPSGT
ncbi:hypothetical protein ACEE96_12725 [Staphylococcus simulans]